ncbi:alpha/beta hydrolase [Marinobacter sp. JSM 1782161]|uniref:alpha/beta hydrolase n=1 Tax=Marinobacter sp. JSM 1782161 TaxID=2685906 RepID=UPI0014033DA3|nr:alpha/beta hydrolase [Marinobacter sp. JSM 1782161]
MYWKTDNLDMPDWDRASLINQLRAFEADRERGPFQDGLSQEVAAYCRFYGLDLWVEHPDVQYSVGNLQAGEHRVAIHCYRTPRPRGTVFILHGYFDHVGLYSQLIDRCLGAGFNVLAYDQPGHGLSSGTPAAIGSFAEYQQVLLDVLEAVRGRIDGPWFAVGQSTGGGVLIDYLLHRVPRGTAEFRHVVLLAPLVRPNGWIGAKMLHSLARPFIKRWRRMFSENSGNSRFLRFLREHDPLQARAVHVDWVSALRQWVPAIEAAKPVDYAVTVIQGEKDMTVDWHHNLRIIRNKFSSVAERRLPDGRHHLVNEASDLQATVFNVTISAFVDGCEERTEAAQAAGV